MPGTPRNIRTLPQLDDSCGDKRKFTLFKKTHPWKRAIGTASDVLGNTNAISRWPVSAAVPTMACFPSVPAYRQPAPASPAIGRDQESPGKECARLANLPA
jgi:hypothetical protein